MKPRIARAAASYSYTSSDRIFIKSLFEYARGTAALLLCH